MGNTCPSGFTMCPSQPFTCVVQCPADKGFTYEVINSKPACAYTADPRYFVPITPVPALNIPQGQPVPPTETLPAYKNELEEFAKKFPPVYTQIDKKRQLDDAYRAMQTAENSADQSPQAYQDARVRYYTLLRGDSWRDEEARRVAGSEAGPVIRGYMNKLNDIQNQAQQQQKTIDVIEGVKTKVLSVKDDLKYSVDAFQKQIDLLKNQIQIERKEKGQTESTVWSLLNGVLNLLLFCLLVTLIVMTYRKMRPPSTSNPGYMTLRYNA